MLRTVTVFREQKNTTCEMISLQAFFESLAHDQTIANQRRLVPLITEISDLSSEITRTLPSESVLETSEHINIDR